MNQVKPWLETELQKADKVKEGVTVSQFLTKSLEKSIMKEDEAFAEALHARTLEDKDKAVMKIIKVRKSALDRAETDDEDEDFVDEQEPKTPRKKGYLELKFDSLCETYEKTKSEVTLGQIMSMISCMEVTRRVRFFYDLQNLRVSSNNRIKIYEREFGIKDIFVDSAFEQLERMEKITEKMIHNIMVRSPYKGIYEYLTDTYQGVGTIMAGCIISDLGTPERFRSVSAMWAYCGLSVVGNDPETGRGGHSQRRERGELSNWNSFLRTKLLGVMATCMIKSQTPYFTGQAGKYTEENAPSPDLVGTPKPHAKDPNKCQNVKVLNDYKCRLATANDLIQEGFRVYSKTGKEAFQTRASKEIDWFDKDGNHRGKIAPFQLQRRSKGHINRMAIRYMVKMMLIEVLNTWRTMDGLEPFLTYDEAKLRGGRRHGE